MPGVLEDARHNSTSSLPRSTSHSYSSNGIPSRLSSDLSRRDSGEKATPGLDGVPGGWPQTPGSLLNGGARDSKDGTAPNGLNGALGGDRPSSIKASSLSSRNRRASGVENEKKAGEVVKDPVSRPGAAEEGYFTLPPNGKTAPARSPLSKPSAVPGEPMSAPYGRVVSGPQPTTPGLTLPPLVESTPFQPSPSAVPDYSLLKPPSPKKHRASSPPAFSHSPAPLSSTLSHTTSPSPGRPNRLEQRHTLEVPKVSTARVSTDSNQPSNTGSDGAVVSATGRFSPTTPTRRRGSLQLARRVTRSIHSHSDMQLDQVPLDDDAARWAEAIKLKRASKKQRADTDDERVVVGTKVDEHHQNYVLAYNMLGGIRFCVSRVQAKIERELTEADFLSSSKHALGMNGDELTPSSKYDYKFKDYAPWVFRQIRTAFGIDPADYLVSLTAKYILSELGSPGKSGSFFYFSRDYKYIIKTIHHAENKFLRKILPDYYNYVLENPNTLLSQFYGLHRVKLPYGKKVHFVIMNNLFPPHRDIHRTFDLKGSTIGRDFREVDLEKNPRATLKDLNWLRRNLHLEFGPTKKEAFVAQMQKDVALLQRLKIMDYSMLVGIHDLERGNEENLRDKTLQVFQPGGSKAEEPQMRALARTPSKLEHAARARHLRETVNRERPVPMAQTIDKLPDESHRKSFYFYADEGGFRATHEDDHNGEEIYYLGIIDCLTRYNFVKKAEHFWKGMGGHESQISPIPPERYGERFIRFISGVTMSREQAEKVRFSNALHETFGAVLPEGIGSPVDDPQLGGINMYRHHIEQDPRNPDGTDEVIARAEHQLEKTKQDESHIPDLSLSAVKDTRGSGDHTEHATLPVIGEAQETASNASQTPSKEPGRDDLLSRSPVLGGANAPSDGAGLTAPPTPPKDESFYRRKDSLDRRESNGGAPPPTPPKDRPRGRTFDKDLPVPPIATKVLTHSPTPMVQDQGMKNRARGAQTK
ncbi:Phosphatidylinositol-4-phosphate 5-kinase [Recurvomyces mirabilis]|nr:Phosphatidylinositol-4-phosphate 5-kinase [Recurvomyces mirabilis]